MYLGISNKKKCCRENLELAFKKLLYIKTLTALQSRTGPEQGFPCVVFPCEKNYTGKTLFSLQGWVCSVLFFLHKTHIPNYSELDWMDI
jgi:hypothetical protein